MTPTPQHPSRPAFGQPGWRRRIEASYSWDKEFKAVVGFVLVLFLFSLILARGDDNTGLPGEDPKDVAVAPAGTEVSTTSSTCDVSEMFLPIPEWSHFQKMPPLPEVLTPMGKKPTLSKPSPAAVAETKPDAAPAPKVAPKPAPAPTAADNALIAVSPFLQWIKDHPKEAAEAARKQAAEEGAAPAPATTAGPAAGGDPYWMPPMIDAAGQTAPTIESTGTGSAAIYSTPQR